MQTCNILFGLAMVLALGSAHAQTYTVRRYMYTLQDSAANKNYPEGNSLTQHHCILFADSLPVSVVGTYGNYGYFEGTFQRGTQMALLEWWEVTSSPGVLTPSSGMAAVAYSENWAQVSGGFGSTGLTYAQPGGDVNSPTNVGTYLPWQSMNGVLQEDSTAENSAANFMQNCLLVKPDTMKYEDVMGTNATVGFFQSAPDAKGFKALSTLDRSSWSSEQGSNDFCAQGYDTASFYQYLYRANEEFNVAGGTKETGNYGPNALRFSAMLGQGLVGVWEARTGPLKGSKGTDLYMVAAKRGGGQQLIGFYCKTDPQSRARLACFPEQYDVKEHKALGQCSAIVRSAGSRAAASSITWVVAAILGVALLLV